MGLQWGKQLDWLMWEIESSLLLGLQRDFQWAIEPGLQQSGLQ
jgi:hypothetical protein